MTEPRAQEGGGPDTLAGYFKPVLYDYHSREALVYKTGFRSVRLTYLDLYDRARRMANWFGHNGLGKGDAILLWAPNGPEWVSALLACALTGVIAVPLDVKVKADFVRHVAGETEAKAGIKSRFIQGTPGVSWWDIEDLPRLIREAPPTFTEPELSGDDILEIVYTSGTTAEPKGVILTNRNIVANIRSLTGVLSLRRSLQFLSVLPLSHMLEQTVGLFVPLFYGCSITYLRSLKSSVLVKAMCDEGITSIVTVPLMLQTLRERIMREIKNRNGEKAFNLMRRLASHMPLKARRLLFRSIHRRFGGRLRFFAVGGAPLEAETEGFWRDLGVKVIQGYGLTETSPIVACNTLDAPKAGTVGRVLPGQQLRLSEEGEILVRGDNVTPGYFKRPDLHTRYFDPGGWYHTGDIGEIDSSGCLRIKGRTKNMILTPSGLNVYPEDIEAALNAEPEVKDSCVLGIDRDGRTLIHAVLLLKEGAGTTGTSNAKGIVEAANKRLSEHQKIQAFSVWEGADFPRTHTLKVQRRFVLDEIKVDRAEEEMAADRGDKKGHADKALYSILSAFSGVPAGEITEGSALGIELQIDSLRRVELAGVIEEAMGVELDEALITHNTTVGELERLIDSGQRAPAHARRQWPLSGWAVFIRRLLQYGLALPLVRYYIRLRVMGREKFAGLRGPFLLIANHMSHLDALLLTLSLPWGVRRKMAVAAAADVFEHWDASGASLWERIWRRALTGLAVLGLNIFPFQRYAGIKKSLEHAGELMDGGWSVMIFPEGRLSQNGKVGEFKAGAGLLAREMGVPVVPAKIRGIYEIMDYRYVWPQRHGTVTVRFGDPIEFSGDESYEEITRRLEHEVRFM